MSHPHPLLVLHGDPAVRATATSLAGRVAMQASGWSALLELLRQAAPGALALVDPYAEGEGRLAPGLKQLLAELPSVSVVAALELVPARMRDVHTLQEWGVAEVVALPAEVGLRPLQHVLAKAAGRSFLRRVKAALPFYLPGRAVAVLLSAAAVAYGGGGPAALGRALGCGPRALARTCTEADLPRPSRLMRWMRALLLAHLLDDPGRAPAQAAVAAGYLGEAGMDAALRRVMPASSSAALRAQGAMAAVTRAFLAEVLQVRERAHDRRADRRRQMRSEHRDGRAR
jgi:hypothetical protein